MKRRRGRRGNRVCGLELLELRRLMTATPSGFTQTINYVENAPAVQFIALGMAADDPNETLTGTLTLADPAAGSIGGMKNNGGGHYDANTGVWSITGNLYNV